MNLFQASTQWSSRPADERFESLEALDQACRSYRQSAAESHTPWKSLKVTVDGDEIMLNGRASQARLSHWAFGQLCARSSAPASYLRQLPATLAATCLSHGLTKIASDDDAYLMFHRDNGNLLMRAVTSERYTRIWNSEVTGRLLRLPDGWRVPPARPIDHDQPGTRTATAKDVLSDGGFGLSIKVGDLIAPAGLYASDHDLFVFMVNEQNRISESSNDGGLARGFFCWNSEVGAATFGVKTFLYRHVCGNHIVWDAADVHELRVRHIGNADERAFHELSRELRAYENASASDLEAKIKTARAFQIGKDKDAVLDAIFRMRIPELSRKRIESGYQLAEAHTDLDGSPRSVWGLTQGLTRLAQTLPYADERVALDRAAGKVLQLAF